MEPAHVVIAIALGDGEADYGVRLWSERFRTAEAAEKVAIALKKNNAISTAFVIED